MKTQSPVSSLTSGHRAVYARPWQPLTVLFLLTMAVGFAQASSTSAETLPPLNDPPTADRLEGKFIWADLFTPDPAVAARFYEGMFEWASVAFAWDGRAHIILQNHGRPVAGIVQRPGSKGPPHGRWVGYVAVNDVARTLDSVQKSGGKVLAPAREFPRRGTQAICADRDGAVLGLLHSISGDTADYRPEVGDWIWAELFASDPTHAATFYREVFGYEVTSGADPDSKDHLVLAAGGFARAGIVPLNHRERAQPSWIGIVRVANADAAAARASSLGGQVLVAPRVSHLGARFAIIADPSGGALGVIEFNPSAPALSTP